jgi:enoyl-CoA hydratase/carnithine racemase
LPRGSPPSPKSTVPRVFCAGADLKERREMTQPEVPPPHPIRAPSPFPFALPSPQHPVPPTRTQSNQPLTQSTPLPPSHAHHPPAPPPHPPFSPRQVGAFVFGLRSAFSGLAALPMPTIASVEGGALGGGLELSLSCDFRVAGEVPTHALRIPPLRMWLKLPTLPTCLPLRTS